MSAGASDGGAGRAFTGLIAVRPGEEGALGDYLTALGKDIDGDADIPFAKLRTVHFMRFVVLKGTPVTWLAFESNYDGALDAHLDELLRAGAVGVHRILRSCAGYPFAAAPALAPADVPAAIAFLTGRARSLPTAAFHVGVHGKTAERIRLEAEVRDEIERFADDRRRTGGWRDVSPERLYEEIVQHLAARPGDLLARARAPQPPPPRSRNWPWLVRVAPLALVLLPFALPLYLLLRIHEAADAEDPPAATPPGVEALADREDFQVQNQLTHVADVKPGPFRRLTLRFVLWAIDLLARYKFNQGALGGISTIHFARWVIVDGGRRLLFFSNFDGSWESYLGDFIDKAHTGLTGVWSNTRGFPRTSNLVGAGASDEERFKSWTRAHQVPTQLWYSAYPELTLFNIQQNGRIAAGLAQRPATPQAMLDWLSNL